MITTAFELIIILLSLTAATTASFRPRRLQSLAPLFADSVPLRVVQATAHWVALIATLAAIAVPFLAFFAACIAFATAVPIAIRGARLKIHRSLGLPIFLAIASLIVALSQPLGLKVLALPKAANLPFHASPAHVIKTYDEGLWFEGIAAADDGPLYLSGNRGLDFSREDYYRYAHGELIAHPMQGSEYILFKTPNGLTAGVPLVAPDNSIYLTGHGDISCIWHLDKNGEVLQVVHFPSGAWPNGLDFGPDSMLYSPDSRLGVIWRVDPKTGRLTVALRDHALLARPFLSLAPGANGLHFRGRNMIVTVSDRTTVLQYPMDYHGNFAPADTLATGIPGDDFAIGQDGSLFITTHPYNTIARVAPNGERTIIGQAQQHIQGATDAVFGTTARDRNTLYIVTDGGAFTGGPTARGELIALDPYAR